MEVEVNDGNFKKEVLESEVPVLVDFWAPWCMPCLMVAPAVSQIAKERNGSVKVCKVNVDEAGMTAQKYGVQSIPTLALFRAGKETARVLGAMPKAQIEKALSIDTREVLK